MSIYSSKNYDQLLNESLTALAAQTNITQLGPGSKARSLLEIINQRLAGAYQYLDQRLANSLLASATDIYLDFLGDLLACPRLENSYAWTDAGAQNVCFYVASGTFGDLNNGNSIVVPAGTTLFTQSSDGDATKTITYQVTDNTILPANENLWYVSVQAALPGSLGAIGSGALVNHSLLAYPGLLVKNLVSIANGQDRETDDSYRYRLSKRVTASAEANETAVRLACLSVPGVADVLINPYGLGAGSFEIFVISTSGRTSDALLDLVQHTIDQHQALGITGKARAPITVGLQFQAVVHTERVLNDVEASMLTEQLTQQTVRFMSSFHIGQAFIVNNLLANLIGLSSLIKTIGEPNKPFAQLFIWKPSRTNNGRRRFTLTGNYNTSFNEIVQLEMQDNLTAADFRLVTS